MNTKFRQTKNSMSHENIPENYQSLYDFYYCDEIQSKNTDDQNDENI